MTPAQSKTGAPGNSRIKTYTAVLVVKALRKTLPLMEASRIGVGEPGVQGRNGGVDGDAYENEPEGGAVAKGRLGEGADGEVGPFGAQ